MQWEIRSGERRFSGIHRFETIANGVLWLSFHAAFPWQVLVTLVPITLILPYIVQRRRSTWVGVAIHAGFGAIGFLVLAFGLA